MLLTPEIRSRLRGIKLSTRGALAIEAGLHTGRGEGAGLEFAQYRAYEPGDELRRIDWRLYARSDRFFVRDAVRDSAINLWVVLDASASMGQADGLNPGYSKFIAGKILAACLAEIALRQSDAAGIALIGDGAAVIVPAAVGARHRERLERQLETSSCGGGWPGASRLAPLWRCVAPGSLVVFISDGFDAALPLLAGRLAAARRRVLSIGVISCEERDFPFVGGHRFHDPETGEERRVDAPAAREEFLERFAESRRALKHTLARAGVRHVEHVLDEPVDAPLRRVLNA